ncbi:MAG: Uma2 family endonuclease [Pseudonocardia sp.]|nr:Uma2 family endonuclease [Pseudonocardia sp.]
MTEALLGAMPSGGWTVDDLDQMPVSNIRYELTDGAMTVSPSPSNLHQRLSAALTIRLAAEVPPELDVAQAVEIRFARQLTRIPDVMLVRSDDPGRHWFAPAEVVVAIEIESPGNHIEDRTTKPVLYARYGIPHYWRIELLPLQVTTYQLREGDTYHKVSRGDRIKIDEPLALDIPLVELLPRWARRG